MKNFDNMHCFLFVVSGFGAQRKLRKIQFKYKNNNLNFSDFMILKILSTEFSKVHFLNFHGNF